MLCPCRSYFVPGHIRPKTRTNGHFANLGNALGTLGERESGTARLEDAAAYRLALTERTQARVPMQWAETRYNMGNVGGTGGPDRRSGRTDGGD